MDVSAQTGRPLRSLRSRFLQDLYSVSLDNGALAWIREFMDHACILVPSTTSSASSVRGAGLGWVGLDGDAIRTSFYTRCFRRMSFGCGQLPVCIGIDKLIKEIMLHLILR